MMLVVSSAPKHCGVRSRNCWLPNDRSHSSHSKTWPGELRCWSRACWLPNELFEADLFASLAYQLAHLHIKGPKTQESHNTLRYRHIGSGDWDIYIRNLSSNTNSAPRSLSNSVEPPRTKFQPDDAEVAEDRLLSIRSALQTSINVGREVLGFLV
jgi:hypothetical protein